MPLRTLTDAGVILAGSSDYPVVDFDVLASVQAAATRRTRSGLQCEPEEALSVEEGLRAYTAGSALALGVDNVAGTLQPGKRADIVVLSDDPTQIDVDTLTTVIVRRTYVGGELAFATASEIPITAQ
ncbi:amidohydrolase family protein [Mycolicibacterium agri]|uniref:Amidohydrolase 3 domain-containing protein n=1 Tax=Mycolicibacterium agri TaxID=36811 RepID=A0A7I9W7T2_MYCAG|nr:amidohydrolase family protein [Mycolicibacterium agri]GFG53755.1 hypothetical protein MAGR_51960 [Mycolicibacterium agri]